MLSGVIWSFVMLAGFIELISFRREACEGNPFNQNDKLCFFVIKIL